MSSDCRPQLIQLETAKCKSQICWKSAFDRAV